MFERYEAWFSMYNESFYEIVVTLIAFYIVPYYVQFSIF